MTANNPRNGLGYEVARTSFKRLKCSICVSVYDILVSNDDPEIDAIRTSGGKKSLSDYDFSTATNQAKRGEKISPNHFLPISSKTVNSKLATVFVLFFSFPKEMHSIGQLQTCRSSEEEFREKETTRISILFHPLLNPTPGNVINWNGVLCMQILRRYLFNFSEEGTYSGVNVPSVGKSGL